MVISVRKLNENKANQAILMHLESWEKRVFIMYFAELAIGSLS